MRTQYVKLTLNEFNIIREEIYSAYTQSGCMDEDAMIAARKAFNAVRRAEKRNNLEESDYTQ